MMIYNDHLFVKDGKGSHQPAKEINIYCMSYSE
jgi:hypothetical protein